MVAQIWVAQIARTPGVGYNSVATVAVDINNPVARGYLIQRQNSAPKTY